MTSRVSYRGRYKYQLVEDLELEVSIRPTDQAEEPGFIVLRSDGRLTIRKTYAWDGPSGPTIDTANFMRGSLVHDALYQLIRNDRLPDEWRHQADLELKKLCLEDGMWRVRAWWVYLAVRLMGRRSTDPWSKKPVRTAP